VGQRLPGRHRGGAGGEGLTGGGDRREGTHCPDPSPPFDPAGDWQERRSGFESFADEIVEVFNLVATQDDDPDTMSKEELVKVYFIKIYTNPPPTPFKTPSNCFALWQAHQGDHGLFEQLDADADGNVTMAEWQGFCQDQYAKKGKRKPEKADNWLGTMLHTLEANLDHHQAHVEAAVEAHVEAAHAQVADNKEAEHAAAMAEADLMAARVGWEPRVEETRQVFYRVAGIHEEEDGDAVLIDKGELIKAHHGDHGLFEELDADADGQITLEEWMKFCETMHGTKEAEKERFGDNWLDGMLHVLEENTLHREKHVAHQVNLAVAEAQAEVDHGREEDGKLLEARRALAAAEAAARAAEVERQAQARLLQPTPDPSLDHHWMHPDEAIAKNEIWQQRYPSMARWVGKVGNAGWSAYTTCLEVCVPSGPSQEAPVGVLLQPIPDKEKIVSIVDDLNREEGLEQRPVMVEDALGVFEELLGVEAGAIQEDHKELLNFCYASFDQMVDVIFAGTTYQAVEGAYSRRFQVVPLRLSPARVATGRRRLTKVTRSPRRRLNLTAALPNFTLGIAEAQLALGGMYITGRGTTRSDEKAAVWFEKAATQGDVIAASELGGMCEAGRGTIKSDINAARWYKVGAEGGDPAAQSALGQMYKDGRGGLTKSNAECVRWFRKAAEAGFPDAQYAMAVLHAQGKLVPQSDEKTEEWFGKAAAQGHEPSIRMLKQKEENDDPKHDRRGIREL